MRKLCLLVLIVLLFNFVSAVLLSDQGTDVRDKSTGNLTALANLTIEIYDNATGGNLIFNQTSSNAIANGSWNVMINPNLEYGKSYWKDYSINGQDLDFDGTERLEFQSPLGLINNASFINFSLINSCSAGSSIRLIYGNGSVVCETDDSGSGGSLSANGIYLYNDTAFIYFNETLLNSTIDLRSAYSNGTGLSLSGKVLSLIATCSNNQVLKWNSASTSWQCSNDESSSVNLTNYALKNQSETFIENVNITGNITSSYGFFSWLGSLVSRITKLFVQDIDFNGTINGSGNILTTGNVTASYFIGNGGLLTGISAGSSNDTIWNITNSNYLYNNSGILSVNETKLNNTIDSRASIYNETSYISNVNTSLSSRIDSISGGNGSWNQTLADTLYSGIQWGYNMTTATYNLYNAVWLSTYNATYHVLLNQNCPAGQVVNGTLANGTFICMAPTVAETEPAWNGNYSIFTGLINNASYLSTYNATYAGNMANNSWNQSLADTLYAPISSGGDNSSWNESYADTKYAGIQWGYNQTTPAINYASNVNTTLSSRIDSISGGGNASFNQSLTDSLYISQSEEANLNVNSTTWWASITGWVSGWFVNNGNNLDFNETKLNETIDARASGLGDNSSWNQTLANSLYAGIEWDYNQTTPAMTYEYNQTTATYDLYNAVWSSTYNATYAASVANNSWNESLAHTLFDTTYNATYAGWAYNQTTPAITYASNVNTSLSSRIDSISGGNASFNQSLTDTLYSGIEWDYNQTTATYDLYNAVWSSTYNATYAGNMANNSWNQSLANSLYAGIIWGYNMTSPFTDWLATFAYNYNQTTPAMTYEYNQTTATYNLYNAVWSSTYNATYAASVANNSFNQSLTDTLYAGIEWDYNQTAPAMTYEYNQTTATYNLYNAVWSSTYNATYAASVANNSWNQSLADTLYAGIIWGYNMTSPFADWLATFAYNYNQTTPAITDINNRFWNRTQSYNKTEIDSFNASWSSTYNATYATNMANNSFNQSLTDSLYIAQSEEANLNVNSSDYWDNLDTINETQMENNGGVLNILVSWLTSLFYTKSEVDTKVGTADLHLHNAANITSPLWVNKTGDTMTGNLNMSVKNVTSVDCIVFASGGKICSAS